MNLFRRLRAGTNPAEVVKLLAMEKDNASTLDEAPTIFTTSSDSNFVLGSDECGIANNRTKGSGIPLRGVEVEQGFHTLTVPHKILAWPHVYAYLQASGNLYSSDLRSILEEGTAWFIKGDLWKNPYPLPPEVSLSSSLPSAEAGKRGHLELARFHVLTIDEMYEFSDAYFKTFNAIYPLLDRATFINEIVQRLLEHGCEDGDFDCVLAFLVFALGQVAIEGVYGQAINMVDNRPSGFHGGSFSHPPGLGLFNEARRRLGFVSTQCNLQNVQIMLLQATYYQSTARHLDFWRSTIAASSACQALIQCQSIDWSSTYGDLVKRAYWTCVLTEGFFHIELDLPQTQIHTLEDLVPLPYSHESGDQQDEPTPAFPLPTATVVGISCQEYQFLAMITLRRIIARAHNEIHVCEHNSGLAEPLCPSRTTEAHDPFSVPKVKAETLHPYFGPPTALVRELERQLDCWRAMLPTPLQWDDDDDSLFSTLSASGNSHIQPFFSIEQGSTPIEYAYNFDIVAAQLRTRFFYAQFMIYRPFIYKALHLPDSMTVEDRRYCVLAIKSVCEWPFILSPPKDKKRLTPHTWVWPQHFMGILLILDLCSKNEYLRHTVECGLVEQWKINRTIQLMQEWIQDAAQIDGVARRSWDIVKSIFGLDPFTNH